MTNDPWTVAEDKRPYEPLPAASYIGVFKGYADTTVKNPHANGREEPRWRWTWEVSTGEYAGKAGSALTECGISPASAAGRLIAGMAGRPIRPGESVRQLVDSFVGKMFMFSVQPGPKGGRPQVRMVSPMPQ